MIHPVILSGGSGTRLWPLSRQQRPKQALKLIGQRTMFQHAVDRIAQLPAGRLEERPEPDVADAPGEPAGQRDAARLEALVADRDGDRVRLEARPALQQQAAALGDQDVAIGWLRTAAEVGTSPGGLASIIDGSPELIGIRQHPDVVAIRSTLSPAAA